MQALVIFASLIVAIFNFAEPTLAQFPLRPKTSTSDYFKSFRQSISITSNPTINSISIATTMNTKVNSSNFIDAIFGINSYNFMDSIPGFSFNFTLDISDTFVRIVFDTTQWVNYPYNIFEINGIVFLMDYDAPYAIYAFELSPKLTFPATMTSYSFPINITISNSFKKNCYSDSNNWYSQNVNLFPMLLKVKQKYIMQLLIVSTSINPWRMGTTINMTITGTSANGYLQYMYFRVIAICSRSYYFTSRLLFFQVSMGNVSNTQHTGQCSSNCNLTLIITGLVYNQSQYVQSHDISAFQFTSNYNADTNLHVFAIGYGLNCTNRYVLMNASNCKCDQSSNFYYIPTVNANNCTLKCPPQTYADSSTQTCKICNTKFNLCLQCIETQCTTCITNIKLVSTTCVNCSLFNPACIDCNLTHCLACKTNFIYNPINAACQCSSDRYIDKSYSCILCNSTFSQCAQCNSTTCLNCTSPDGICGCASNGILNTKITPPTCTACQTLYGQNCNTCNMTQCLTCLYSLSLFAKNKTNSCQNCSILYSLNCTQCDQTQCIFCAYWYRVDITGKICVCQDSHYLVMHNRQDFCLLCKYKFSNCIQCNQDVCTSCSGNFVAINGTCQCFKDRFLNQANVCIMCNYYDSFCLQCIGQARCTKCLPTFYLNSQRCSCEFQTKIVAGLGCIPCQEFTPNCAICGFFSCKQCLPNFQLFYYTYSNNICRCNQTRFLASPGKCTICKSINANCSTCNSTQCFTCFNNLSPIAGTYNCSCQLPIGLLINNTCQACTALFPQCLQCNYTDCFKCPDGWALINNTCSCNNDRFLRGQCVLCTVLDRNCFTCLYTGLCLSCYNNFTPLNNTRYCVCNPPMIIINSQCQSCNTLFPNCLSCNVSMCLSCLGNYLFKNGNCTCVNDRIQMQLDNCSLCSQLDVNCLTCNLTQCLSCSNNFVTVNNSLECICQSPLSIVVNVSCQLCNVSFQNCNQCNNDGCLICFGNYIALNGRCDCSVDRFGETPHICTLCTSKDINCLTCNTTQCLSCNNSFTIKSASYSCNCISPFNIVVNFKCVLCNASFANCIKCDNSGCFGCSGNYIPINGSCVCSVTRFELPPGNCILCSSKNSQCLECDSKQCYVCNHNFTLIQNTFQCSCITPLSLIVNSYCTSCPHIYSNCIQCNSLGCLKCFTDYQLINKKCLCQNDRFQLILGFCNICNQVYSSCATCDSTACLSCISNFTLVDGVCQCLTPKNAIASSSILLCLSCKDEPNAIGCTFSSYIDYVQIGNKVYFNLKFTKPDDQVQIYRPIHQNILVSMQGINVPFKITNNAMSIEIPKNKFHLISFVIIDKSLILWKESRLNSDPAPIQATYIEGLAISNQIISLIFYVVNITVFVAIFLSFGGFNRIFEELNITAMLLYFSYQLSNNVGNVLDSFNKERSYILTQDMNAKIDDRLIQTQQIKMAAMTSSKPLIQSTQQVICVLLMSVGLIVYIRSYLLSKRKPRKHFTFRNILDHSSQYLVDNITSICTYLSFPALIQLKVLIINDFNLNRIGDYTNIILSLLIIVGPIILIVIHFKLYPPSQKRYSMAYCSLDSQKGLAILLYFFTIIRPLLLGSAILFLDSSYSLFIFIGINAFNMLFIVINVINHLSIIGFVFKIMKCSLGVFIGIAILLSEGQQSFIVVVAAYCVLAIAVIQIIQFIVKMIIVILRNKLIISDIRPLDPSTQKANKTKTQKKALLDVLGKAKQELSNLLARKRNRTL